MPDWADWGLVVKLAGAGLHLGATIHHLLTSVISPDSQSDKDKEQLSQDTKKHGEYPILAMCACWTQVCVNIAP